MCKMFACYLKNKMQILYNMHMISYLFKKPYANSVENSNSK